MDWKSKDLSFRYSMLDRFRMDCDYFLGNGNGFAGHLYYKSVEEHIKAMRELYKSFTLGEQPEWLSYRDIDNYEKKMLKKLEEVENG